MDMEIQKLSKVITANELNEILNDENLVIFDLRSKEDFEAGHIPGALNINNREFEDPDNPIDGEIATSEQLEAVMSSYGLKSTDRVVVYAEAARPQMGPRLIWTLEFYDHTNTHLLDGQYEAWVEVGLDVEEGSQREIGATEYEVIGTNKEFNVDHEYVLSILEGDTTILDCRPTDQYTGENTGSNIRYGHIPGAVNLPYINTIDEDGYFLSINELKAIYEEVGITGEEEVVIYCQRGHRSSHSWFVLHHILGYKDIKVYDGSMMEWANGDKFPMVEWGV